MSELIARLFPGEALALTERQLRILRHYEREMAKGHMTLNAAEARARHDLAGRNGAKDREQRRIEG